MQHWEFVHLLKLMSHKRWQLRLLKFLLQLCSIAATRPHAAYCAFTHGMVGCWIYVMRTIPNISPLFKPFEDAIYLKLIPLLTSHSCCTSERELLSLPCGLGSLGIINPTIIAGF